MRCNLPDCPRPAHSGSYLCREHRFEIAQAQADWQREAKVDKKLELSPHKPVIAPEDDWRASAIAKAVLPRRVRLFGSETASRWRLRDKEGSRYAYNKPVNGPDNGLYPIEYLLAHVELKAAVNQVLKTLTPRCEIVIRLRFGLPGEVTTEQGTTYVDTSDEMTCEEVGEILGVSRGRINQIEQKAFRMLKHPKRNTTLLPFVTDGPSWIAPADTTARCIKTVEINETSQPTLPQDVLNCIDSNPTPSAFSIWYLTWIDFRQPKGAVLGNRTVGWTTDDLVAADTGKIIGIYKRLEPEITTHRMVIWITEQT